MVCMKCNGEMKSVKMHGDAMGTPVYLTHKKQGIFETEKRSLVECFVCTQCGYVELKAVSPEVFKEI